MNDSDLLYKTKNVGPLYQRGSPTPPYLAWTAQSDFECHPADAVGRPLGNETYRTGFLTVFTGRETLLLHVLGSDVAGDCMSLS